MKALLFDCDGVLADTERDGHRPAFNLAFAQAGLTVTWDVPTYGELLKIGGGKERMRHYFDTMAGWPVEAPARDELIARLHRLKTDLFMRMIESGQLPLRPGVARLVDEGIGAGVTLAVCSTSHERAVHAVVERLLGARRRAAFAGIFAGDIVPKKKPAPDIYLHAASVLGLSPAECVVIEDSANGLRAARAAGMRCLITTSAYTQDEDFTGAARVVPELGDPPAPHVTLGDLRGLVR
jgi:HAD superfamily hydrolase (TIGR01509 family)